MNASKEISKENLPITLVVAPSRECFFSEARERIKSFGIDDFTYSINELRFGGRRWIFCPTPEHMRGFHGVDVEFWGPVHRLKDPDRWRELAIIARLP